MEDRITLSPGVWLGFAVALLAVAFGVSASREFLPSATVAALFWVFICLSALSLFAAVREYYIREGIRLANQERETEQLSAGRSAVVASLPEHQPEVKSKPKPNIRYLEVRETTLSYWAGAFIHAVGPHTAANGTGVLAVFLNEPRADLPVGETKNVQAKVTLVDEVGSQINVVVGWWFGAGPVRADFAIGTARELLLAVAKPNQPSYTIDARRLGASESTPIYTELIRAKYDVAVQLISDGVILGDFDFVLDVKPRLNLRPAHRLKTAPGNIKTRTE